jgi:glutathione synthase/RimK-type ligase-like ATP-grasp enzyme
MSENQLIIGDKMLKTYTLLQHEKIKDFIPKSVMMSRTELLSMLNQYQMVYVKPIKGTFGKGVMRVERLNGRSNTEFRCQYDTKTKSFRYFHSLYLEILMEKMDRPYMIQQGIDLLKYRQRRFDVRIMVQKNSEGQWESTGIIGRLAHPKKIVTNYHSGGTPMSIRTLLKPHLSDKRTSETIRALNQFGQEVAIALGKSFFKLNTIGVDIGLDPNFKPWILEVNTNPDPYFFRKLKHKETFRKVYRFAKKLRRIK